MQSVSRLYQDAELETHVYSLCFFQHDAVVPEVMLIDAASDMDALCEARDRRSFLTREVWQGHRLVGVIPPQR